MDAIEQARRYVATIPGAVAGNHGHDQTYSVAVALTNGFRLNEFESLKILEEFNARCSPAWTQKELEHKIQSAIKTPHDKPPGHLLNSPTTSRPAGPSHHTTNPPASQPSPKPAPSYWPDPEFEIPAPMEDGARVFLKTLFKPDEGVCICRAVLDAKTGREIPEGTGIVLTQSDWLKRLDAKGGDPNGIFKSADRTGIYVRVNAMKVGGSKDADVTSWRYALIEFDKCSISEQLSIYQQSNIPCAAIILSGGKSAHAWVKVDAKDANEFAERVRILHEHFSTYGIDSANKNPSRFSRLPGCERFGNRQELIELDVGASSWLEWNVAQIGDDLGELLDNEAMEKFDPKLDVDCIIGDRWQSRGGSCLIVGPSGVGKSSLCMQMAMLWNLGIAPFGIEAKKPLTSLIVQAENNFGDMAEMYQGVTRGIGLDQSEIIALRKGIKIRRFCTASGYAFIEKLKRMINLHKPDIVWIDPLFAYIFGDVSKQEVCSQFLRHWLNPISEATGVCFFIAHHTNKPIKDPKSKKGFSNADLQYEGAGSAELVNWSRAVMVLQPSKNDFVLHLAKRGFRAGAVDFDLERTTKLRIGHSTKGICWEQLQEEKEESKDEGKNTGGKPEVEFQYEKFIESITGENLTATQLCNRAMDFSSCSKATFHRKINEHLKSVLGYDAEFKTFYVKPSN